MKRYKQLFTETIGSVDPFRLEDVIEQSKNMSNEELKSFFENLYKTNPDLAFEASVALLNDYRHQMYNM